MLDLPGIIEGAKDGKGRGRQVIAVAKNCNLIFIVLDVLKPVTHKKIIENELEGFGIRVNKEPPNIVFRKKEKGGINMTSTVPLTHLDSEEVRAVLTEYRINSADIAFRCDATVCTTKALSRLRSSMPFWQNDMGKANGETLPLAVETC